MSASVWVPTDSSLYFTKNDPNDIRLGDCTSPFGAGPVTSLPPSELIIWGYPDHEGIQLNGGREGAALAPAAIRKVFYKMTPHVLQKNNPRILDGGDVTTSIALKDRHDQGASRSQILTSQNLCWASLGGGHDYGYADGAGFLRAQIAKRLRPIILNFDAHLDVRPADKNLNSGTPFRRLLTEFAGQFDFVEVGLQPQCNSRQHWAWALSQGAQLISLAETEEQGLLPCLQKALGPTLGRPLWVSLDIDAITSNEAPGCSQSWTKGLKTDDLWTGFQWMMENFDWRSFSIYEVSPPLDSDLRTVKLAALFLHRFLSLRIENGSN
jgi:formiminoglutamase